jgi:hypothetical protein
LLKLLKYLVMKKIMFSLVAVAALTLVSCGGPSVCDCVENAKKGDKADKDVAEKCEKMVDGKSDEEKKKLEEEAAKCK